MRRSTTGEAVEALLSGTAIAPAGAPSGTPSSTTASAPGAANMGSPEASAETAAAVAAVDATEVRQKPSASKKAAKTTPAAPTARTTPAKQPTAPTEPAKQPVAPSVAALSEPISLPSRKKFEETHTRSTFYVENELLDYLNTIAVEKGQKTFIINEALRRFLAAIQTS